MGGAGLGSWSAVLFLALAGGRGPRPLGARGGDALAKVSGLPSIRSVAFFFLLPKFSTQFANGWRMSPPPPDKVGQGGGVGAEGHGTS